MPYDYDRRRQVLAAAGDLSGILVKYHKALTRMEESYEHADKNREDSMEVARLRYGLPSAFSRFRNDVGAALLFWGILQTYKMSKADLKVIEKASKEFSKNRIQPPRKSKEFETYKKKIHEYKKYFDVAERVLRDGEEHGEETTAKAGPFTLVNVGGFSDKQMQDVVKVVEKAAQLIRAKGQNRICYGNIQVTNTISNAKTLAFYSISTDEMFIRGNLKGKQGPALSTVIHELGHRLHFKFLKSKDRAIKDIYKAIKRGDDLAFEEELKNKEHWPEPGEEISDGKRDFVVEGVGLNRTHEYVIKLVWKEDPRFKASLHLRNWLARKGVNPSSFVTGYAKTNHEENFAEMFAHYAQDLLEEGQVKLLEAVLS